jgi:Family of unknown function (DUF5677)
MIKDRTATARRLLFRLVRERDQSIQQRGRELVDLASRNLPLEFEVTHDAGAWPLIGAALASRMTTTLRSILDLQPAEREADAGILLRSLYEHAVHLAWLGADPSVARIEEWRRHDLVLRLTADTDMRQHGVELLTNEIRAELEAQVGRMQGHKLVLAKLAVAADQHWTGTLPGMSASPEVSSFRGSARYGQPLCIDCVTLI